MHNKIANDDSSGYKLMDFSIAIKKSEAFNPHSVARLKLLKAVACVKLAHSLKIKTQV